MGPLSSAAVPARVVVVDDHDEVREVTEMILAEAGHSVRATAHGFEALRWLEEQPCPLILDLQMSEIDGPTPRRHDEGSERPGPLQALHAGCPSCRGRARAGDDMSSAMTRRPSGEAREGEARTARGGGGR
jgi:hypothetical protein